MSIIPDISKSSFPFSLQTTSSESTEDIGAALAQAIINNDYLPYFVALYGDLGVGKTAFVRGFTREIAPNARVKSPTFALVKEYKGKYLDVFHFDMYRIDSEDDLYSIGFYDYFDRKGVCLVEWSEKIEFALPSSYLKVEIIKDSAESTDSRTITITYVGT